MKKALFVLPNLQAGGAERVTLDLLRRMPLHQATLFVLRPTGEFWPEAQDLPLHCGRPGWRGWLDLWQAAKEAQVLVGALEIKTHLWVALLGWLQRKPVVGWLHKDLKYFLEHQSPLKRGVYRALAGWAFGRMQRLVAVSRGVAQNAEQMFASLRGKTVCIYNPVDAQRIGQSAAALPALALPPQPWVLAAGRLTWQKGFDLLIEAHAHLRPNWPHHLVIVGEGEERERLQALVERLGVADSVSLPGFAPLPALLARANAFVLSSRYEGLPTVLIEALVVGTPVLSTDCPVGPREVLQDGRWGVLVAPESPQALAQGLLQLMQDPLRHQRAQQAQANLQRFDPQQAWQAWQNLLEALL